VLKRAAAALLVICAATGASGCGASTEDRPNRSASLMLDSTPNAVHAGISLALARDFDGAEGVELRVRVPSSSTDAVKLLLSDRAQFAVLDIHDLALARAKGRDVVGVMALVERPLAAVIARPGIRSPRDLEGRTVGVTGLPGDDAVLASIVRGAGGDPARVMKVTIGLDAVPALLSKRVDASTAFWNVEGVAMQAKRPGTREFRVDDYGAPAYPELVLCVARQTLQDSPALVRATVAALQRGYTEALADPESAVEALVEDARGGLDRATAQRQFDAVQGAFTTPSGAVGVLDVDMLRKWARWEARFGITRRMPDVARAFAGPAVGRSSVSG
jgi:ABC-type nitrate/sulfonate/bicarbonate transport system substrate-binding protein